MPDAQTIADVQAQQPFTYSEAKKYARWVHKNVRGAYGIYVIDSIEYGNAFVKYRNACGMERFIHNLAEFIEVRESEA